MGSIQKIKYFFIVITFTLGSAGLVRADGTLISDGPPVSIGDYCGKSYVKYTGVLTGSTSTGSYKVPFFIRTPADPMDGNGFTLYEFPHFRAADNARRFLGLDFLFCKGFSQAAVGYDTTSFPPNRILDPSRQGVFINGGNPTGLDVEIMKDFAQALDKNVQGKDFLNNNSRNRIVTGFSNSSRPVISFLYGDGDGPGYAEGLFDLAMPFNTFGTTEDELHTIKDVLIEKKFTGKVIIVNAEWETFRFLNIVRSLLFADPNEADMDGNNLADRYRFYVTAGSPHLPDIFDCKGDSGETGSTPATFHPELRARFLQGWLWVTSNSPKVAPPPSTQVLPCDGTDPDCAIVKQDENGNTLVWNVNNVAAGNTDEEDAEPRLPYVELGEATYIGQFFGFLTNLLPIDNFDDYLMDFTLAAHDYKHAGYMREEDEAFLLDRASAIPGQTFTETYLNNYEGGFVDPDRPACDSIP